MSKILTRPNKAFCHPIGQRNAHGQVMRGPRAASTVRQMCDVEAAWVGALIEGEGSIIAGRRYNVHGEHGGGDDRHPAPAGR